MQDYRRREGETKKSLLDLKLSYIEVNIFKSCKIYHIFSDSLSVSKILSQKNYLDLTQAYLSFWKA